MSYVITEVCVGTCETACVDVCPMDCIHGPIRIEEIRSVPPDKRRERLPSLQLFINPEECISCGACTPQCPVQAIYDENEVPRASHASIERNARFFLKT